MDKRKRFQEINFLEAALFGYVKGQKSESSISIMESIRNFMKEFNIEGEFDELSLKIVFYRCLNRYRNVMRHDKKLSVFPSQINEVMSEISLLTAECSVSQDNINEQLGYIQELISKIETNGR